MVRYGFNFNFINNENTPTLNAVEIEEAISDLAALDFDSVAFPYAFLEAFGNTATTIKQLKSGVSNKSDIAGGVLQRSNIHIAVCALGEVIDTLRKLKASPLTSQKKAKFILATDGIDLQAEDMNSGEIVACDYKDFPNYFGFFLPLAGITTVKTIRNNPIDIQATSRLNRLYIELLRVNEDWATDKRRQDMNQFMTRLIFCFFAEDTDIFLGENLFTQTIEQMSAANNRSNNTDFVMAEIFRAMDLPPNKRADADLPSWADAFPYVNGGLFSSSKEVPKFSRAARAYLLHAGSLNWKKINPDIFGSMIQAVADENERGELGMHYTSVPNILKVLNPLFLDNLREQLIAAKNNARKLLNLRKRIATIRVFDPACGSGNFLVIAYKELRALEAEINQKRGEKSQKSCIPLTNFRGIELKSFPAEIARLALIIAEYQCDVLYRDHKDALAEFLPLNALNWITCGNALRLDWLSLCPPTGKSAKLLLEDMLEAPLNQQRIDFTNEGGETYICGNPPYKGSQTQTKSQKADLAHVFKPHGISSKQIDYVGGWFMKATDYAQYTPADSAFVSTNSLCQGRIVPILWSKLFDLGMQISFAHTSFKWANLASHNAGVTVVIVGITKQNKSVKRLFSTDKNNQSNELQTDSINAYLAMGADVIVQKSTQSVSDLAEMQFGNMPNDGGNLLLSEAEVAVLHLSKPQRARFIKRLYGSAEFIRGLARYCLWIEEEHLQEALSITPICERIEAVREARLASKDKSANKMATRAHQMREMYYGKKHTIIIPSVSSVNRDYLPVGLLPKGSIISNAAFALYDAPLWNMALIISRIHLVWIGAVCGKLKTDFRYSNTLGWNTFPVPFLTEKNKADLTRCAENILLAREVHFPATIADLYAADKMPDNLSHAHKQNDEVLERIYIGRKFKNDTERLEKLFALYSKMTS